jgi:hypothetical protein
MGCPRQLIFGSDANADTPTEIEQFVTKAFYANHGIPGIPNANPNEIIVAARGERGVTRWCCISQPSWAFTGSG